MRTPGLFIVFPAAVCAATMAGTWKMDPARSFTGATSPKSLTVRIEPHAKGSLFTLDRATSSSTILYLDSMPRDLQDFECSGTQSSRWLNRQTMEIRRVCAASEWTWLVRQSAQGFPRTHRSDRREES